MASMIEHGWQMFLFAALLAGPVPLLLMLRKYLVALSTIERVLSYLVIWSAIQVTLGQVLGHLGGLKLEYLLALYAAVFIFFIAVKRNDLPKLAPITKWAHWSNAGRLDKILLFVLGTLTFGLLVMVLSRPATDYDSLSYHLPAIAKWYSTESLVMEKWKIQSYYPYNWEILGALSVMPFREDYAVTLPGVLAWILFGLSIWAIAVRVEVSSSVIVGGLGLILTMPLVIEQINTMFVDLPLAAYFLAGFVFILAYRHSSHVAPIMLLAVTIGMLIGIKTSGIAYGGVLMLIAFLSLGPRMKQMLQGRRGAAIVKLLIAFILAVTLVGGGWYVRNLVEAGNPLAPVRVEVAGRILFPGTVASAEIGQTTKAAQFDFNNRENWQALANESQAELGVPMLILLAIGLLGLFILLIKFRKDEIAGDRALLIVLSLLTLVVFWYMPYSGYHGAFRYALPTWGLWGVIGLVGLQSLRIPAMLVLLSGIIVVSWATYHLSLSLFGLSVLLGAMLIAWEYLPDSVKEIRGRSKILSSFLPTTVLLAVVFLGSFAVRHERDVQRQIAYGPIQEWMDIHFAHDTLIGYALCPHKYLLFGKYLDRPVTYVPLSLATTPEEWVAMLRQRGVTIFATGPLAKEWARTPEIGWLQDDRYFEKVWGEDATSQMVLYQLRSDR